MFGKLFNKKKDSNDNWSLAQAEDKNTGAVSMFLKNIAPSIQIGDENYPYVSYLTFHYEKYNKTGLPDSKEEEEFSNIQDIDLPLFEKDNLAIHLASVTQNGIRDYIFQTSNPEKFLDFAEIIRNKYPKYDVDCEVIKDLDWSHYIELPGD